MEPRPPYSTDLTDREGTVIEAYVPTAKSGGRPEKYPKRDTLNALADVAWTGCAWRLLPHAFPRGPIVDHDFRRWRDDGTWQVLHDLLRGAVRVAAGKARQPSAGSIDSPSVKTTETGGATGTMRTST